ncbi:MAG: signal peptide peptidase SppA, partial [Verrucomicrobia bacterium]
MKAFFASFVGTLLALAAFCFVSFVLVIGSLALLASMGEKTTRPITSGSYLVLNLDGLNLTDAPPLVDEGGLGWFLSGDAPRPLALRRATATLRSAATDPRIRGVLLTGNFSPDGYGTGFAALREFRSALMSVRESGKPIKVYFDQAGTAELYLASVAQEITLNPFGLIIMPGLASEPMFFGEAFEKWGVGVQVTRSGKYKGAIEPFTRRDLSPENREQLTVLLNDLWSTLSTEIATARGTTAAALQTIINAEGLLSPEVAEAAGLISKIAYRDELLATLHTETGAPLGEPFLQVAFSDYAKST